jgi:hypothetical protein
MSFTIDLNSFYLKGASKLIALKHYHQVIRAEMDALKWIDPKSYYNRIPEYLFQAHDQDLSHCSKQEMESLYSELSLKKCSPVIFSTLSKMVNDPLVMGALCNNYHLDIISIDMWDGVEPLSWHFDGSLSAPIIGLMYFNDLGNVDNDYGGQLVTGTRQIGPRCNIMKDYGDIEVNNTINPSDRTLVFVNNAAPIFVHKVTPLKDPLAQRLTLTFGCTATVK